MAQVDHILVTRFNLPSEGVEGNFRTQPGWLEHRVHLFERYCLPSVRAQRESHFQWLIYFDPDSPEWLKSWIDASHEGQFAPIFRRSVTADVLRVDLEELVQRRSRTLITTNLDNDDGLARDFVARVQASGSRSSVGRAAVYLSRGLIKSESGVYLRTDRHNAFCSVREGWDLPMTCWADWHNRLSLSMPVEVAGGAPAWLQVVHGTNVSNRVRGRLVSPRSYLSDFVGLEDVVEPSPGGVWADRLGRMPIRVVRDSARTTLRKTAVGLLGKDGVNRAKAIMAGGRRAA